MPDFEDTATPGYGVRILELRGDREWTQAALAAKVGVARETISRWECEVYTPRGRSIQALAQAFGVSPEWISTGARIG